MGMTYLKRICKDCKNIQTFSQLLMDNLKRWNSPNYDEEMDDADEEDEDDVDDSDDDDDDVEEQSQKMPKRLDEDLENSIFEKLGQAQPIPPSEIPDFEER